ncbi:DUF5606 family protein [Pedobacter insulae]|uniref:Uncharacterized protein n=1 Tax=Pedobacter insulae TaxID=414048 RepID=A0A1I2W2N6_9SPHI|nr:DUF5606 domain-containing protein [Pedobacter insulae]SFG94877.1 hypothetical protein SAMN04489864_103388 [Pedobacter insulae]
MNLRGIVAVSGRPGLFKLIGQNKAGYVLESLDAQKLKIVANLSTTKLASLEDITIYGENQEIKLIDVLTKIGGHKSVPDAKIDGNALKTFFEEVAPDYDKEKVYTSDMKKIVGWYNLLKDLPLFTETAPNLEEESGGITEDKVDLKPKATAKAKPTNSKAPTAKSAPAKKASMTSKKGV